MVNQNRMKKLFEQLSKIGRIKNGGITRLGYSALERQAQQTVEDYLRNNASLVAFNDRANNFRAAVQGADPSVPVIAIGSHLDTPYDGGAYDGAVGVVIGAEVLLTLAENHSLAFLQQSPVEVISFACEESSRFGYSCLGSRAMFGALDPLRVLGLKDEQNVSLKDAMIELGVDFSQFGIPIREASSFRCFIEPHVEQGPILEDENYHFGIVTQIAGASRYSVTLVGKSRHSGTTPVATRDDALVGASRCITATRDLILSKGEQALVGGVGTIKVPNGSVNVVPGITQFVLEVRDIDNERKAHAVLELEATFRKIAFEENLQISFETLKEDSSAKLSERLADKLIAAAARMGKRAKRMHSGAAHDGLVTHTAGVETSVVFLPSRDGISHNPEEYTPFESIVDGANLVLDTVLELTKR